MTAHLIGRDAIGALVHPTNPVDSLTTEELRGIFTGSITNWNEVGGPDLAISVYIVYPQSATRRVFAGAILDGAQYAGDSIQTIRPDKGIIDRVANDPGAIGHLSFALVAGLDSVKLIAPDGQAPSVDNPHYPITRPLYLITNGQPTGSAAAFIDWARSDAGQAIVKRYFVGIGN